MATITPIRRQRQVTPERWQAALRRAYDDSLDLFRVNDTGEWFATSASERTLSGGTVYRVSRDACSCPAGAAGDPVCKHRALLLAELGYLDLDPDPAPVAPKVVPLPRRRTVVEVWQGGPAPAYRSDEQAARKAA